MVPPHDQPDPFRALETDSEETRAWQERQNAAADGALRDWDGFGRLREAVALHLGRGAATAPVRRGGS
jgi:hypothetical protein